MPTARKKSSRPISTPCRFSTTPSASKWPRARTSTSRRDKLDVAESATLIAMLKGTSYYNPVLNPERALTRRNVVLAQMVKRGVLSQAEFDRLKAPAHTARFRAPVRAGRPRASSRCADSQMADRLGRPQRQQYLCRRLGRAHHHRLAFAGACQSSGKPPDGDFAGGRRRRVGHELGAVAIVERVRLRRACAGACSRFGYFWKTQVQPARLADPRIRPLIAPRSRPARRPRRRWRN